MYEMSPIGSIRPADALLAVTARSVVCDEAVSTWAEQEIASLVVRLRVVLSTDPLAMTTTVVACLDANRPRGELF